MKDRGFTLLEIVLAVAVIGLMATVVIGVSAHLLSEAPRDPEAVFWRACQEARKAALDKGGDVRLAFDDKAKAFVLSGALSEAFAIPAAEEDFGVELLSGQEGGPSALVGGVLVSTQMVPYVTFFSDGTCVPFRVQIRSRGGVHVISIDPWTCAQVLAPENTGA